jgi:hypothetical protein
MPLLFGDRVKETSTSVGLSSFSLDGAVASFQSFADGIGTGNQCFYTAENSTDNTWEVGIGTVSGASLSRDSVLSSSNSGSPVNFAAGTKQIFATEAAQHFNNALDTAAHNVIDHTGLPGVPVAEAFDAAAHASANHTGLPGVPAAETFDATAHNATDHTVGPFNLLDVPDHATLDHTGIPGVGGSEAYDQAAHDADDHTGATLIAPPSQVEAETGTATTARLWTALRVAQAIAAQTGLQVATGQFTAASTITLATGFLPKLVIYAGRYTGLTPEPTIGFAVGTGAPNQGCTVSGGLESVGGVIAADSGGDAVVDQSHAVTQFDATQVVATQSAGAITWNGIVIVLGG